MDGLYFLNAFADWKVQSGPLLTLEYTKVLINISFSFCPRNSPILEIVFNLVFLFLQTVDTYFRSLICCKLQEPIALILFLLFMVKL